VIPIGRRTTRANHRPKNAADLLLARRPRRKHPAARHGAAQTPRTIARQERTVAPLTPPANSRTIGSRVVIAIATAEVTPGRPIAVTPIGGQTRVIPIGRRRAGEQDSQTARRPETRRHPPRPNPTVAETTTRASVAERLGHHSGCSNGTMRDRSVVQRRDGSRIASAAARRTIEQR